MQRAAAMMKSITASPLFLPFMLALIFAAQMAIRFQSPLNVDSSWYFWVATRMQEGQRLFSDILEVNPPFGILFSFPALWFAQATGAAIVSAFYIQLFLMVAGVLVLANMILKLEPHQVTPRIRQSLILMSAFGLTFLPMVHFGQREHMASMLILPWLLLRFMRLGQARVPIALSVVVGVLAATAVALKPHAILAPLLVECVVLAFTRRLASTFATENLAAIATAALFGATLYLLTPEFFTVMLNLGVVAYVPFYGEYASNIIAFGAMTWIVTVMAAIVVFSLPGGAMKQLAIICLAASLGFTVAYFVQMKGFPYQLVPSDIFAFAAIGASMLAAGAKFKLIGPVLLALTFWVNPWIVRVPDVNAIPEIIAKHAPGKTSYFVASTLVGDWLAIPQEAGYRWASNAPAQWLMPYVQSRQDAGDAAGDAIVTKALKSVVDDFIRERPDVVIIDTLDKPRLKAGRVFDYLGFWKGDPRFEDFWSQYQEKERNKVFIVYTRM
jgi:hypothetical protein